MITPKVAFLFPGQGSQSVGMGAELAKIYNTALQIFSQADSLLGYKLSQIAWDGPSEVLNDTETTQPALLTHSISVFRILQENHPELKPDFVAGHSMGEISALVASGALTFPDALLLVRKRGELMKKAGENSPGGMAAILGLDIEKIEEICIQASDTIDIVQVANDNCPGQTVISGSTQAINKTIEQAKKSGARRAIPLNVSIAAHSPLMQSAQSEFNSMVDTTVFEKPTIPIIGNVTADMLLSVDDIRADLKSQLTSKVKWTSSIQRLIDVGVNTFLEIGNGTVLCGLIKRIDESKNSLSISNPNDLEQLSDELKPVI